MLVSSATIRAMGKLHTSGASTIKAMAQPPPTAATTGSNP